MAAAAETATQTISPGRNVVTIPEKYKTMMIRKMEGAKHSSILFFDRIAMAPAIGIISKAPISVLSSSLLPTVFLCPYLLLLLLFPGRPLPLVIRRLQMQKPLIPYRDFLCEPRKPGF